MNQNTDRGRELVERRRSNAAGKHRNRNDRRQNRRTRKTRAIRESLGR